jgi:osmoprotectant transport system permease protein
MQSGVQHRSRTRLASGAIGLAAVTAVALLPHLARPQAGYVIGGKTFTEQYVLAALIEQRLKAAGLPSSLREGLGSNVIVDALAANEIDVYVDYTGTIWANLMGRTDVPPRAEVLGGVAAWLKAEKGITLLGELGFENAYALAMSRKKAEALGIRSVADLARHSGTLSIAGDYEFFARPEWAAIRQSYGLTFRAERQMQPEFMYPAIANGEVDVITAYTSDGQITKYDLVVLDDPKGAVPPYDAILLVAPRRANDAALRAALRPLIGGINVEAMRAANLNAASGGAQAAPDVVANWLWEQMLLDQIKR